jgi:hypothetical protein
MSFPEGSPIPQERFLTQTHSREREAIRTVPPRLLSEQTAPHSTTSEPLCGHTLDVFVNACTQQLDASPHDTAPKEFAYSWDEMRVVPQSPFPPLWPTVPPPRQHE